MKNKKSLAILIITLDLRDSSNCEGLPDKVRILKNSFTIPTNLFWIFTDYLRDPGGPWKMLITSRVTQRSIPEPNP